MHDKDDFEPLLSPEFSHLEKDLRYAQQQLDEVDAEMARLPNDKGLTPELERKDYNPPGMGKSPKDIPGMTKQLEDRKTQIWADFSEKLDKALVNTDPKAAKNVRDTVDINLSDSEYRKMNRAEVKGQQKSNKSTEKSEAFMNKSLANYRATKTERPAVTVEASKDTGQEPVGASERFSSAPNYSKELGKVDDAPDKTPDSLTIQPPEIDEDKD